MNAQQARRILDRLVGYELSPLLQKGLKRWDLSAGRVQSVALRLIVDREREIEAFVAKEYWSVEARLAPNGDESAFLARLFQVGDDKLAASPDKKGLVLSTQEEAEAHVARLREAAYRVGEVRQKEVKRTPAPPFTTSTLQQEAARKLGFSARKTMQLAQRLYEGIELPGEGQVGLITYMRTDSVNIAEQALAEIAEVVKGLYGAEYALTKPRRYKKKQRGAQEAHEAIRPDRRRAQPRRPRAQTRPRPGPAVPADLAAGGRVADGRGAVRPGLRRHRGRRDVARPRVPAAGDRSDDHVRRVPPRVLRGPRRRRRRGRRGDAPRLTAEQALRLLELLPEQHFTQPPPRFTEASLVKALEENGIGRPSTYAPTISTLVDRGYVRMEDRRLFPEDVGMVVTDILVDLFPDIVDVGFTARMEQELDDIAEGDRGWATVLREFYDPFHHDVENAADKVKPPEVFLDERCPRCPEEGREPGRLVVKLGRYGKFVGCENYPECKFTRPMEGNGQPEPELLDEACPECGKQLMRRVGRYGPFVGCSGYPDCKYVKKEPPKKTGVQCPKCGKGELVERRGRFGPFYSCERYPECDFSINQEPMPEPCPSCKGLVVKARGGATRCTACAKAWAEDGTELPEEEAKALVPKPRAKRVGGGGRTGGRSGRGSRTTRGARARGPSAGGDQAEASA